MVPVPCRRCLPEHVRSVPPPTWQRDLSSLTGREEDVAALLAQGQTNQQIAVALGLGEGTVKGHVRHLRVKQRLHSRAEATAWARERAGAGSPPPG
jgi:DNA-binding CsgD family transcriptional regulator